MVGVFAQFLEALACYHERGLVAGGKRPFHLRVTETDAGPRLRLLDPGGLIEEWTRVEPSTFQATVLAPERRVGARIDRRANLYEAGMILYELLAGSSVFERPPLAAERDPNEFAVQ